MSAGISLDDTNLKRKIAALHHRIRQKTMRKVGSECAKIMQPVLKSRIPVLSGLLRRSIGRKVKVFKGLAVWAGVGPRKEFRSVVSIGRNKKGAVKFTFLKRNFKGHHSDLQAGQRVRWPNKYAHLAGPRRKARFVAATISATRARIKAKMASIFKAAINEG